MAERELIVKTIYEAAEKSFTGLLKEHPDEDFYYFTIVSADEYVPCISAMSYESWKHTVDRYRNELGYPESKIPDLDLKYSWADSPYCGYGYDEYFGAVEELFEEAMEKAEEEDPDEGFVNEFGLWYDCMTEVMKLLDEKGIFGVGEKRRRVVITSELSPPDDDFLDENTKRLNPEESYNIWKKEFREIQ